MKYKIEFGISGGQNKSLIQALTSMTNRNSQSTSQPGIILLQTRTPFSQHTLFICVLIVFLISEAGSAIMCHSYQETFPPHVTPPSNYLMRCEFHIPIKCNNGTARMQEWHAVLPDILKCFFAKKIVTKYYASERGKS